MRRRKIARTFAALATFATLATVTASTASAQFATYTDRTAFQNALSGFFVDNFNTNAISTPGASVVATDGSFGRNDSGFWGDRVTRSGGQTIWSFVGGKTAFGGDWDLRGPGGEGQGVVFSVNYVGGGTGSVGFELPRSFSGEFFGFIADNAFNDVIVSAGTQSGIAETYNFDNMTTNVSVVPEPSTYMLMATGLGLLGVAARRRKA